MAIEIVDPNPRWPAQFEELAAQLRASFGATALSIDHIGSTAVPGLPAKPIIDVQVTVRDFAGVRESPRGSRPRGGRIHPRPPAARAPMCRTSSSRSGPLGPPDPSRPTCTFESPAASTSDMRCCSATTCAPARPRPQHTRRSSAASPTSSVDDRDAYYAVKDPVCDLIMVGAEAWAAATGWRPAA